MPLLRLEPQNKKSDTATSSWQEDEDQQDEELYNFNYTFLDKSQEE